MIGIIFDILYDELEKRFTERKSNKYENTTIEKKVPREFSDELEKLRHDNSLLTDKIVEISEENYRLIEENKILHDIVDKLY